MMPGGRIILGQQQQLMGEAGLTKTCSPRASSPGAVGDLHGAARCRYGPLSHPMGHQGDRGEMS